jgi:hypothetical protein
MAGQKKRTVAAGTRRRMAFAEGRFLNDSAHSNLSLIFAKSSPYAPLVDAMKQRIVSETESKPVPKGCRPVIASGGKREPVSWRNVETLIANIVDMWGKGKKNLSVSLDTATYGPSPLSGSGFVNLLKVLSHDDHALLRLRKGFRNVENPELSRLARVRPLRKFRDLLTNIIFLKLGEAVQIEDVPLADHVVTVPPDLIELRYTETKITKYTKDGKPRTKRRKTKVVVPRKRWEKEITKEQNERLRVIRDSLQWFNLVLGDYEKTYTKTADNTRHVLHTVLYAVYTDDFNQGGRFYTGRGGHQSLSKAERRSITFNGHSTVELDFGGLHIRMLYALAGRNYPLKEDPYDAVLTAMGKDPAKIKARFPEIRDDLKVMLLALVNGKIDNEKTRFQQAVNRANHRLFHDWYGIADKTRKEDAKRESLARKRRWTKAGLLDGDGKPSAVIRGFHEAHKPIREAFSTGCGLYLQNIDATIAYWVLCELMISDSDRCIPCLPVHDSFITFSEYKNTLKHAMQTAYNAVMQQVTGTQKSFKIPVKTG